MAHDRIKDQTDTGNPVNKSVRKLQEDCDYGLDLPYSSGAKVQL